MPLPQTTRTAALLGKGRSQRATSVRAATSFSMRRAFSTSSRIAPPTILQRQAFADAFHFAPRVG